MGASGYGRYSGEEGFKNFSNRKGCILKGASPAYVLNLLSPPMTPEKHKSMTMAGTFPMRWTLQALLKPVYYVIFLLMAYLAYYKGGVPMFPTMCMFTALNWVARRYNYIYDN